MLVQEEITMRTRTLIAGTLVAALVALAPATADARGGGAPSHPFGLGVMIGTPTGISGKLYLGNRMGLAMGLGEVNGRFGDDGLHVHVDVLWHPHILLDHQSFTMPLYVGVGGRILEHDYDYYDRDGRWEWDDDDTHLGVRVPGGILMDFKNVSLDIFFELALVADVIIIDDDDFDNHDEDLLHINGALGVRYYF